MILVVISFVKRALTINKHKLKESDYIAQQLTCHTTLAGLRETHKQNNISTVHGAGCHRLLEPLKIAFVVSMRRATCVQGMKLLTVTDFYTDLQRSMR